MNIILPFPIPREICEIILIYLNGIEREQLIIVSKSFKWLIRQLLIKDNSDSMRNKEVKFMKFNQRMFNKVCFYGHIDIVNIYLDKSDYCLEEGIISACKGEQNELILWLMKQIDKEMSNYLYGKMMKILCEKENMDIINLIFTCMELTCDISSYVSHTLGKTGNKKLLDLFIYEKQVLLGYVYSGALQLGNIEYIEHIAQIMAKDNITYDKTDWLECACKSRNIDIVRMLVEEADIDPNYGLLIASKLGEKDILEYLINNGADKYNLCLYGAAQGDNIELVKYSINCGADDYGRAFGYSLKSNSMKCIKHLYHFCAPYLDRSEILLDSCLSSNVETVGYILSIGNYSIDILGDCLARASLRNDIDIMMLLINYGAVTFSKTLEACIYNDNEEAVKYLMDKYSDSIDYSRVNIYRLYLKGNFALLDIIKNYNKKKYEEFIISELLTKYYEDILYLLSIGFLDRDIAVEALSGIYVSNRKDIVFVDIETIIADGINNSNECLIASCKVSNSIIACKLIQYGANNYREALECLLDNNGLEIVSILISSRNTVDKFITSNRKVKDQIVKKMIQFVNDALISNICTNNHIVVGGPNNWCFYIKIRCGDIKGSITVGVSNDVFSIMTSIISQGQLHTDIISKYINRIPDIILLTLTSHKKRRKENSILIGAYVDMFPIESYVSSKIPSTVESIQFATGRNINIKEDKYYIKKITGYKIVKSLMNDYSNR